MVKGDSSLSMKIRQYVIAGRKLPTEEDSNPTIYRMRIFASDEVRAKSRFWYFLRRMNKVKKSNGEIVSVKEVQEKHTNHCKTYGLMIRYETRTIITNMYREYRDTSVCGAVGRMYQDMAGRHRARPETIHIINAAVIPTSEQVRRPHTREFYNPEIKFPLIHQTTRPSSKRFRSTFVANRPTTLSR